MSGSVTDVRTNTLPRRTSSEGLTLITFDSTGAFAALEPVGAFPTPEAIGAADAAVVTTALAGKQSLSEKGLANGYAGLDENGKVPSANLPLLSGGGSSVALANTTPAALGEASSGVAVTASRSDHVHPFPTTAQIGAAPIVHTHSIPAITDLQNQLDLRELLANKGIPSGYAPLGSDGKIPFAHLPAGLTQADLESKADAAETTAALALKVNTSDLQNSLDLKADYNDPRIINAVQPNQMAETEAFSGAFGITFNDANKVKYCTSATDVPISLNSQPEGFTIRFVQTGTGKIIFSAAVGQTVLSFGNALTTAGAGADVTATVYEAGKWHLSGRLV